MINTAHSLTMSEDREVVALISAERAKRDCTMLGDVWEVLSKATVDLKGRGVDVPPDIYNALRGAKNLITLCKGHPKLEDLNPRDVDEHEGFCVACCGADITARIKCELRNIEDLLVLKATNELGTDYAVKIQEKAGEAWKPLQVAVS